jgi:hypothetical protein
MTAPTTRARDEALLAAGLCLSRIGSLDDAALGRVGTWLLATIGERFDLPPAGVVADLGALLHGERLISRLPRPPRPFAIPDPRLAGAMRRYEDAVLARLDGDPRITAGAFAIARLPPHLRPRGVAVVVSGILGRIGWSEEAALALQPGVVRAAMERPLAATLELGHAALRDQGETREGLARAYEALVRGAQKTAELVSAADVFALENLHVLQSLSQRVAIAQVVEAQEAVERRLPRRVRSTRKKPGPIASRAEDESAYPVGGFSSISTSGVLENLVASELVYMETSRKAIDLFDLRYAEGELLYYTRDEAILTRPRRLIAFYLGDDLAATRLKDPALPWQRIVCLMGLLAAVIARLERDLSGEELSFRVVFVRQAPGSPAILRPERALSELLLREWIESGTLSVVEATLASEAAVLHDASRRALVEPVVFSARGEVAARQDWERAGFVQDAYVVTTGLEEPAELDAWAESASALLSALL